MNDKEPETLSEAIILGIKSGTRDFFEPTVDVCQVFSRPFVALFRFLREKLRS